jgi:hypothetical protein
LGYLAWAACAKDPGFSPSGIIEEAGRANRHSEAELRGLDFDGEPPDARELSRTWRAQVETARLVLALLPAEQAGRVVLDRTGRLFRGDPGALREALRADHLVYHPGSIRGALPHFV